MNLRIKVVQYMHGPQTYFGWSQKINRHYCQRHGYEYVLNTDPPRAGRSVQWQKVPTVLSELKDCDYLLFVDADAIFYGQEFKIEDELLPLFQDSKLLLTNQDIASEKERWHLGLPSLGVFLARVCRMTRELMEVWDGASQVDPITAWEWPLEQLAFWHVVLPKYKESVQILDDYYLLQARDGYFIRHYSISPDQDREQAMQKFCETRGIP